MAEGLITPDQLKHIAEEKGGRQTGIMPKSPSSLRPAPRLVTLAMEVDEDHATPREVRNRKLLAGKRVWR